MIGDYDAVMVRQPGKSRRGRMDKRQAMEEVLKLSREKRPGGLSTGMCEALDISFESFLKFSQLSDKGQLRVIDSLADMFERKLKKDK